MRKERSMQVQYFINMYAYQQLILQLLDKAFVDLKGEAADGRQFIMHRIDQFTHQEKFHCFVLEKAGKDNIDEYIEEIKGDKLPILEILLDQLMRGMYMLLCTIIIDH